MSAQPIDDGGPAFPYEDARPGRSGMSLRDYFAAKAMAAFVINRDLPSEPTSTYYIDIVAVADGAYRMADAMLKARKQ
jgi:hypothetical protein